MLTHEPNCKLRMSQVIKLQLMISDGFTYPCSALPPLDDLALEPVEL